MKLEMIKGQESSLIIESAVNSISEDGFLADSYSKAFHALRDYVQHTDKIRRELSKSCPSIRNNILYRSPQNIISFSGKRGSGKSSTMLSFSSTLANPEHLIKLCGCPRISGDNSSLKAKRFTVLDPIDPTTLEENQSILSVILSRLLFKAEEIWSQHTNFYGGFQDKERQKTELLVLARQCLNGINTIKSKKDMMQELSDLQKVGDSSILKKDLYDFVEMLLQFGNTEKGFSSEDQMLVIQIDDTDCQISRGYEVMEDIRKYLTIPNTLILMATDMKLLRQVLTQHYVADFSRNLSAKLVEVERIRNLGEKYLTKLMPPSHVIHLPNVDEIIRSQTDFIHLYYYDPENPELSEYCENGKRPKLNLLDPGDQEDYKRYDFQSVILRYIYKKTHIIFTSHDAYANNIIPTTLRGLAYLLSQFSTMKDVPEIDFDHTPFDAKYLEAELKKQVLILDENLSLFEEYFLHNWIPAKLPQDKLEIVEKLSNQVSDQRVPFIIKELANYYAKKVADKSSPIAAFTDLKNYEVFTYVELDHLLRIIQGTAESFEDSPFRQTEDFYFIFAIRTLLSIKNSKDVLLVKRRTLNGRKDSNETHIVFNYLKSKTSLPTGFYLDPVQLNGYELVRKGLKEDTYKNGDKDVSKFFYVGAERWFNFTGGIIRWLAPDETDYKNLNPKQLYAAQELAALVAANCDIQEVARKAVSREARKTSQPSGSCLSDAVESGLKQIQEAVSAINQGMLEMYSPDKMDGLVWKINETVSNQLNSLQELQKTPAGGDVNHPGTPTESSCPRFTFDLPIINDSGRTADCMDSLRKYSDELKDYLKDKTHPHKIEELLEQLISTNSHFENEASSSSFKNLLSELNLELDKLFPNDADNQK